MGLWIVCNDISKNVESNFTNICVNICILTKLGIDYELWLIDQFCGYSAWFWKCDTFFEIFDVLISNFEPTIYYL